MSDQKLNECPRCKSNSTEEFDIEEKGNELHHNFQCFDCDCVWVNIFVFSKKVINKESSDTTPYIDEKHDRLYRVGRHKEQDAN